MIYEIKLRLQHQCPYLDFSSYFGKKTLYTYCSRERDILIIPELIEEEKLELGKELFSNRDTWEVKESGETTTIIMSCFCKTSSTSMSVAIQKRGGMVIFPIKYENNWEYHKVLAFNESNYKELKDFFNTFQVFEVISERSYDEKKLLEQMITFYDTIENLTANQKNTLIKAVEGGYYNIPRTKKSDDIAEELGVSRYGFQKNLRKVEQNIVNAIVPFLYLGT